MPAQNLQVVCLPLGWKMEELIRVTKNGRKKLNILLSPALVKLMLGGEWPEFHDFGFDVVHSYQLEEDGTLMPMDVADEPAPGPSFKLAMVDDVFHDPPKIILL